MSLIFGNANNKKRLVGAGLDQVLVTITQMHVSNSTKCYCIFTVYAYRSVRYFPITYVHYAYVIPEGNVRSQLELIKTETEKH